MSAQEGGSFEVGDIVGKFGGEARWIGVVVSIYATTREATRLVVDVAPQGFQMIATPGQLTLIERAQSRSAAQSFAAAQRILTEMTIERLATLTAGVAR